MPTARDLLPHLTRDELIAMVAPDALLPLDLRGEDGIAATVLAAKGTENTGPLARFSPAGEFALLSPTRNDE